MEEWDTKAKRLLKAELIKRGISNLDLAERLNKIGVEETKASVDSKISRGRFSACFFLQCLTVIGCTSLDLLSLELLQVENNHSESISQ